MRQFKSTFESWFSCGKKLCSQLYEKLKIMVHERKNRILQKTIKQVLYIVLLFAALLHSSHLSFYGDKSGTFSLEVVSLDIAKNDEDQLVKMSSLQTEEEWRIIFLITAGVYAAGISNKTNLSSLFKHQVKIKIKSSCFFF